jgi:hypothetical protein
MLKTFARIPRAAQFPSIAALLAALACAGCSGFATGGVATLQGSPDRVDVTARTATASAGTAGIGVGTARSDVAICSEPATGRAVPC